MRPVSLIVHDGLLRLAHKPPCAQPGSPVLLSFRDKNVLPERCKRRTDDRPGDLLLGRHSGIPALAGIGGVWWGWITI